MKSLANILSENLEKPPVEEIDENKFGRTAKKAGQAVSNGAKKAGRSVWSFAKSVFND